MFTEKETEPLCWRMAGDSTRRVGGSRLKRSPRRDFGYWRSISAATVNREVPATPSPMNAPLYLDVLAAVRYLRKTGAKNVSVVGGSMGGGAAADASIASEPGEITGVVLLGAAPNGPAEKLKSRVLFIVARDDASEDGPRLPGIREQYEKAPQPKALIILDGSAHAQFLFDSDQSERVMREILQFLSAS
jgi:pimeloyl-ACP methyl ester carboxylesterase